MTISSIMRNPMITRITEMRQQLDELQRQLTTGQKAQTYGGLGTARSQSISFRSKISQLDAYSAAIDQVNTRITLVDTAMTRLDALPTDVRAAIDPNNYQVRLNGQTDGQSTATMALGEMVSLLNTQADGRYLMSGKTTDTRPVLSTEEILNGSGGKDGLKQVIGERWAADRGVAEADGSYMGRLSVSGGDASLTLAAPTLPSDSTSFAFTIAGASASGGGVSVTAGSGGSQVLGFTTGIADGDTIEVDLQDPDGNPASVTLTAGTDFEVGDSPSEAAANFAAALTTALAGFTAAGTDSEGNAVTRTGALAIGGESTVTLSRVNVSDVFGFKIAGANTTSERITTTNAADGLSSDIAFSDEVADGDEVTVALVNPDGTTSTITLTATNSTTPSDGFFSIGANGAATGVNFQSALTAAIKTKAATDLQAASACEASSEFFFSASSEHRTAARVDTSTSGGDLATATALTYDSTADTVQWYQGYNAKVDTADAATLPRADISARIDDGLTVNYGVRANEDGYATMMASLGVMAAVTFDSGVETDEARYAALAERVRDTLSFDGSNSGSSPSSIHAEVAVVGSLASDIGERQTANKSTYQELLDGVEGVDANEVAAQILTLQNNIEASYQTTSMLSQLSLLNYL